MLTFNEFVASKDQRQRPTGVDDFIDGDIQGSLFVTIPALASNRRIAIKVLAEKFLAMTETMDVAITCVGLKPGSNSTQFDTDI